MIKTDEATLFSGFEAIASASGGAGDRVRRRLGQGSGHGRGGGRGAPPGHADTPRAGSLSPPNKTGAAAPQCQRPTQPRKELRMFHREGQVPTT